MISSTMIPATHHFNNPLSSPFNSLQPHTLHKSESTHTFTNYLQQASSSPDSSRKKLLSSKEVSVNATTMNFKIERSSDTPLNAIMMQYFSSQIQDFLSCDDSKDKITVCSSKLEINTEIDRILPELAQDGPDDIDASIEIHNAYPNEFLSQLHNIQAKQNSEQHKCGKSVEKRIEPNIYPNFGDKRPRSGIIPLKNVNQKNIEEVGSNDDRDAVNDAEERKMHRNLEIQVLFELPKRDILAKKVKAAATRRRRNGRTTKKKTQEEKVEEEVLEKGRGKRHAPPPQEKEEEQEKKEVKRVKVLPREEDEISKKERKIQELEHAVKEKLEEKALFERHESTGLLYKGHFIAAKNMSNHALGCVMWLGKEVDRLDRARVALSRLKAKKELLEMSSDGKEENEITSKMDVDVAIKECVKEEAEEDENKMSDEEVKEAAREEENNVEEEEDENKMSDDVENKSMISIAIQEAVKEDEEEKSEENPIEEALQQEVKEEDEESEENPIEEALQQEIKEEDEEEKSEENRIEEVKEEEEESEENRIEEVIEKEVEVSVKVPVSFQRWFYVCSDLGRVCMLSAGYLSSVDSLRGNVPNVCLSSYLNGIFACVGANPVRECFGFDSVEGEFSASAVENVFKLVFNVEMDRKYRSTFELFWGSFRDNIGRLDELLVSKGVGCFSVPKYVVWPVCVRLGKKVGEIAFGLIVFDSEHQCVSLLCSVPLFQSVSPVGSVRLCGNNISESAVIGAFFPNGGLEKLLDSGSRSSLFYRGLKVDQYAMRLKAPEAEDVLSGVNLKSLTASISLLVADGKISGPRKPSFTSSPKYRAPKKKCWKFNVLYCSSVSSERLESEEHVLDNMWFSLNAYGLFRRYESLSLWRSGESASFDFSLCAKGVWQVCNHDAYPSPFP
jgi:hypothetical protein